MKKFISIILALVLAFSMSIGAFAESDITESYKDNSVTGSENLDYFELSLVYEDESATSFTIGIPEKVIIGNESSSQISLQELSCAPGYSFSVDVEWYDGKDEAYNGSQAEKLVFSDGEGETVNLTTAYKIINMTEEDVIAFVTGESPDSSFANFYVNFKNENQLFLDNILER